MLSKINFLVNNKITPITNRTAIHRMQDTLKNDTFIKTSASDISFGGSKTYDDDRFARLMFQAEFMEQSGDLKKGEELYLESYHYVEDYIKENGKKKKIDNIDIVDSYIAATTRICSNLSVQGYLNGTPEEKGALLKRGKLYCDRTLNNLAKYCDKDVAEQTGLKALKLYQGLYNEKKLPIRHTYVDNKKMALADAINKNFYLPEYDTPIFAMTDEEIIADKELKENCISEFYPDKVPLSEYVPSNHEHFDRFTDLTIAAVNNRLTKNNQSRKINTEAAFDILNHSRAFLEVKDPMQLYWNDKPFEFTSKRIAEVEKIHNPSSRTLEAINAYIDVKNTELPLKKRLDALEKVAIEPAYLNSIILCNYNKAINEYAIALMVSGKPENAKNQLIRVIKHHPDKDIKLLAYNKLNELNKQNKA